MPDPLHILSGGAPEGFDARLLAAEMARRGKAVVHVARDDKRLAAMQAALAFFAPEAVVLTFPGWDCLPYDRVSPNAEVSAARMATLAGLAHGVPGPFILLTTLERGHAAGAGARAAARGGVFGAGGSAHRRARAARISGAHGLYPKPQR